ncbi:MAG: LysR family transcriptional regulator [Rhodoferax sp.]|jgi:DNA-binding transcriptional LysR family regulator|nr:LysR family transcriptional regulator [Rhodoferax sp.]
MRDLDLTSLRLFVTVCETRNIARAGERANLAGSAISKRLAQLEENLGVRLLVRRRRGVEPTPAGETLLEHAHTLLGNAERLAHDLGSYAAGVKGQVRVLASASALAESLADDVASFLRQPEHAAIQVHIEERQSRDVVRGIRDGVAALGICWDAIDDPGLASHPYRSDHLALLVHPDHPLARCTRVRFEQTLDYDFVGLPSNSAVPLMLQRAAAELGKTMRLRVVVTSLDAVQRVVGANLAISVIPREVVAPHADQRLLQLVDLQEDWVERRFAIYFRDEKALSPAAALLVAHLQACARQQA